MYAVQRQGFDGSLTDFFINLFNPARGAAQEYATTEAAKQLSSQAAQQAVNIHDMLLKLQAARTEGDAYRAQQWLIAYNTAIDAYNGLVRSLRELEGPDSTWLFLAKLPDIASAGFDRALQDALGKLKKALTTAGKALLVAVGVIAVLGLAFVWVAGKSGAVQVRKVV